jgi:ribosome-binding factor A
VGELIQQELSKIVQELEEPELGFVTITGIKLTDDLQSARVFYSVIGDKESVDRSSEILKNSVPHIRQQLALRLNLRRTPTLVFEYDTTPEKATRIFTLLEQIKSEEHPPAGPEETPPAEKPAGRKTKPRSKKRTK